MQEQLYNYTYAIWKGVPCRIMHYGDYSLMSSEMYVKGKGYLKGHTVNIYNQGNTVTEKEYKEYFLKYIKNNK